MPVIFRDAYATQLADFLVSVVVFVVKLILKGIRFVVVFLLQLLERIFGPMFAFFRDPDVQDTFIDVLEWFAVRFTGFFEYIGYRARKSIFIILLSKLPQLILFAAPALPNQPTPRKFSRLTILLRLTPLTAVALSSMSCV